MFSFDVNSDIEDADLFNEYGFSASGQMSISVTIIEEEIFSILNDLRSGSPHYEWQMMRLENNLDLLDLSYEAVDTSPEELKSLRILGCKSAVVHCFDALENASAEMRREFLKILYDELEKGELTLADCKISTAEFLKRTKRSGSKKK